MFLGLTTSSSSTWQAAHASRCVKCPLGSVGCHLQETCTVPVQEIGQFVAANWTQLEDKDAGTTYFYNQITHRTQFDEPIQPQRVCSSLLVVAGRL